ncbi:MAG: hypothetical protein M3237_11540 [Actinomycetota bacterium]|nr:hypothetical protein [Actinomycetota bacterium]
MMVPTNARPHDDPRNARVWLRRELLKQGFDDRAIRRQLANGQLVRVRHSAYTDAAAWSGLDVAGRHRLRARAVLKQAKTPVVLSHGSGLPEYDAPTWRIDLSNVHVTRRDGKAGRTEAGVQQHCGTINPGDVVERHGVAVMNGTRLALEVTTMASVEASLCVVNHLLHAGETTPLLLAQRYDSMDNWPNTLTTDLVLRLADPRIESVGETRVYYACYREGLPMPQPQYEIENADRTIVARVDFAWPDLGVFLEFDGKIKYEKLLKKGERASDVVIREKQRESLICRLTGWRCIRVTWGDLQSPARLAALIREVLFQGVAA